MSEFDATVTFLGTGTSVGVPAIGCQCEVCQSDNPKNKRTRCSIVLDLPDGTLLIDTPPDLRMQLLREDVRLVHAILFTHEHADHLFGLDDVRLFPFRLGAPVPLFCEEKVERRIRHSFDYAFIERAQTHPGSRPSLEFQSIHADKRFHVLGVPVMPIPLKHGPHFDVLGFRFGDFAYCTDTNGIPDESIERLRGVKTLVVGALRFNEHPTHFSVDQAIEVAGKIGAERTLLTHTGHDLDYEKTMQQLPEGVEMAYDGMKLSAMISV